MSSENVYEVQLWPKTEGDFSWKNIKIHAYIFFGSSFMKFGAHLINFLFFQFPEKLTKKKKSGQFHFSPWQMSFCLGHNWAPYKLSEHKLKNSLNGSKHKILVHISLIFLCIFSNFLNLAFLRDNNFKICCKINLFFWNLKTRCPTPR